MVGMTTAASSPHGRLTVRRGQAAGRTEAVLGDTTSKNCIRPAERPKHHQHVRPFGRRTRTHPIRCASGAGWTMRKELGAGG
jgi:hypothetical protein